MRKTNIELMRLICMILLIMHHYIGHGGVLSLDSLPVNLALGVLIAPLGKICFNAFLVVSCWFLTEQEFKSYRFVKLWLMSLFYSAAIMLIVSCVWGGYSFAQCMGAFFPILGYNHGFAATYLVFYLCIPFLKRIVAECSSKQLLFVIVVLCLIQPLAKDASVVFLYQQPYTSELLLFVLIFFLVYLIKKIHPLLIDSNLLLCGILLATIMIGALLRLLSIYYPANVFIVYSAARVADESCVLNIISGLCVFFIFHNIEIKYNPFINSLGGCAYAVLLIHDNNYLRPYFWTNICRTNMLITSKMMFLHMLLIVFLVYLFAWFIE